MRWAVLRQQVLSAGACFSRRRARPNGQTLASFDGERARTARAAILSLAQTPPACSGRRFLLLNKFHSEKAPQNGGQGKLLQVLEAVLRLFGPCTAVVKFATCANAGGIVDRTRQSRQKLTAIQAAFFAGKAIAVPAACGPARAGPLTRGAFNIRFLAHAVPLTCGSPCAADEPSGDAFLSARQQNPGARSSLRFYAAWSRY